MPWQELYQEHPAHLENSQSPEPELIQLTPEIDNVLSYPNPSSPDPMHELGNISNHPGNQADDPTLDIVDEPEDYTPVPKSPRKSHNNLWRNPASNWKPDFAYYYALDINSSNFANLNKGLDDGPEIQILADLGPDGGLRSENQKALGTNLDGYPTAYFWISSTYNSFLTHSLIYDLDENNTEARLNAKLQQTQRIIESPQIFYLAP